MLMGKVCACVFRTNKYCTLSNLLYFMEQPKTIAFATVLLQIG